MAEKKDPQKSLREIHKRLIEGTRVKVRYGRATLTVRRSVVVLGAALGEALKAHQREEVSAEDVAWRFLREQTISHSPTFDWKAVKLDKLLPRVAGVVREPDLKAQTPEELIAALERVQADELAAKKRLSDQIQKYAAPLSANYLKGFRAADLGLVTHQSRMEQLRHMFEPFQRQQSLIKRQQETDRANAEVSATRHHLGVLRPYASQGPTDARVEPP